MKIGKGKTHLSSFHCRQQFTIALKQTNKQTNKTPTNTRVKARTEIKNNLLGFLNSVAWDQLGQVQAIIELTVSSLNPAETEAGAGIHPIWQMPHIANSPPRSPHNSGVCPNATPPNIACNIPRIL